MILQPNIINNIISGTPVRIFAEGEGVVEIRIFLVGDESTPIYKKWKMSLPVDIDISDILQTITPIIPDTGIEHVTGLIDVESAEYYSKTRVILVTLVGEDCNYSYLIRLFPGKVSKRELRIYDGRNTDIFTARFFNHNANFFLTARSAGKMIAMKETELAPLYFINDEPNAAIRIAVTGTERFIDYIGLHQGIYSLDISGLRRHFAFAHNILVNDFTEVCSGTRIIVERSKPAPECYVLKFRNSFGVFELMEIIGTLSVNPKFNDGRNVSFQRVDLITGSFVSYRERSEHTLTFSIDIWGKRFDEIGFMLDLLSSDEVYLMGLTSKQLRVIASVEDADYDYRPKSPQKFTLNLASVESDISVLNDILDSTMKQRIFSQQFSQQFI